MPTEGKLRRITNKTPYGIIQKSCIKEKLRESIKAENFASGSARNSASLSLSVYPNYFVAACACLAERSDATCL